MPSIRAFGLTLTTALSLCSPALAQDYRTGNPNMGHFFMGRREIQILDDGAQVNDYRTNPAAKQQGAVPQMNRDSPLPRAGWQQYSNSLPAVQGSLPKVINGVPPKMPPAPPGGVNAKTAKAGAYKGKKPGGVGTPTASAPSSLPKTYAPYKGYGPGVGPAVSQSNTAGGDAATKVQGSLLNRGGGNMLRWNRTRPNY